MVPQSATVDATLYCGTGCTAVYVHYFT
uniref:Uncharacterized protein n=1 Tax=Anguilla anguilla TaxID=7936 RepID=A0A0E9QNB4_ANGAN